MCRRLFLALLTLVTLVGAAFAAVPGVAASGTWASVGGLRAARGYHTATALPDGRLLVAGGRGDLGYYGTGSLASAETFSAVTGTWTAAAPLGAARAEHAATLLPVGPHAGRVLAIGGVRVAYPGGTRATDYPATIERYDPTTDTWVDAGALATPRSGHAAVAPATGPLAGQVLVIGGRVAAYPYALASVERYDAATGQSTPVAPLLQARDTPAALALPDGRVLVTGGPCGRTAELYDPVANSWAATAPMAAQRCDPATTLLPDGTVLVAGGGAATPDRYDPATDTWASAAALPAYPGIPGQSLFAPLPGGAFLLVGYYNGLARYDATPGTWAKVPDLPNPGRSGRSFTATALGGGRVVVTGGWTYAGVPLPDTQLYTDAPFALALTTTGGGRVAVAPGPGPYTGGTTLTLTATPDPGQLFTGWVVDGALASYANPLTVPVRDAGRAVVATFVPRPAFPDVPGGTPAAEAIAQLAARGVIKGYEDGPFGPGDPTLRAQMAALICRAVGWDGESWANPFTDRNGVDDALWANIGTLNHHGVARGYSATTYGTTDEVLNIQVVAFVSRAMVAKGLWEQQYADAGTYPNVPRSSGHRDDLATYVRYAGPLPGFADTGATFAGWDRPSTRGWFAQVLWRALDSYYGARQVQ